MAEIIPCPRCQEGAATIIATSPITGVWEVYACEVCLFSWRSTEPKRRTDLALYPEAFQLIQDDITTAPDVPAVPPLRRQV
ncbi:non-oxidative hydroxyarylic acid decarboxylases subunit D [Mycobacteroides immunogenum]|uniref:non-oxidative hydroxyarylic acid decarboxylases subunit D n=1 Tax=Mycobacteroides immunogenum TaxID=83262 RepID=UPI000AC7B358